MARTVAATFCIDVLRNDLRSRYEMTLEEAVESLRACFDSMFSSSQDEASGMTLDELLPNIDRVLADWRLR